MLQLTGIEAMLIREEDERQPQHVSALLIYRPSPADLLPAIRFRDILQRFQLNLARSAVFRRKLLHTPLDLDYPYWLEDEYFELEYHVRRIALPAPGNRAQLDRLLARLHAQPLDPERPLWEAYVIEGLHLEATDEPPDFALLIKVHQAALLQTDVTTFIDTIHGAEPEPTVAGDAGHWQPDHQPPPWDLLSKAYANGFRRPARLVATATRAGQLLRRKAGSRSHGQAPPDPRRTRFNGPVSSERTTRSLHIPQRELDAVSAAVPGVEVDDALAAIVGGALRRYLSQAGELPASTLSAALPTELAAGDGGGRGAVSLIGIPLGTTTDSAIERLSAIHSARREAETRLGALAIRHRAGRQHPSCLYCTHEHSLAAVLQRNPMPFHVLLSRLQAPPGPRYLAGAGLQSMQVMGSLLDNIGLNHISTRNGDGVALTFVACRNMLPDADFYTACLEESRHQLLLAARHNHRH